MRLGDLVRTKPAFLHCRGVGLVLRVRTGANAGTDKNVVEVMWPDEDRIDWHAGSVLEMINESA